MSMHILEINVQAYTRRKKKPTNTSTILQLQLSYITEYDLKHNTLRTSMGLTTGHDTLQISSYRNKLTLKFEEYKKLGEIF